ncbi:MAG: hypothetical protein HC900_00725 [Methylacidiphilales bacterium]|nr:hypothetical protein [Candidatus Methylacidiphilales bacterium]
MHEITVDGTKSYFDTPAGRPPALLLGRHRHADRCTRRRSGNRAPAARPRGAEIAKVDVEDSQATAMKYGIRSIPTLMLFKGGELVGTKVASPPRATSRSGSTAPSDRDAAALEYP